MLWEGGTPRIALNKLTRVIYDGGLALPDVKLYYWASQLQVINDWVYTNSNDPAYRLDTFIMPQGNCEHLYTKKMNREWLTQIKVLVQCWRDANTFLGWGNKITGNSPPGREICWGK